MRVAALLVVGLALAAPARADLFTVGSGGTHTTLQGAVDAALARGGSHEIRIAAGTFYGRVTIASTTAGDALRISGGWLPGFARFVDDPAQTLIDGAGEAPVIDVALTDASVSLSRLTVTGGHSPVDIAFGGGLRVDLDGAAMLTVDGCRIVENQLAVTVGAGTVYGGGLAGYVLEASRLALRGNRFEHNSTEATDGGSAGQAGADIFVGGTVRLELAENTFVGNESRGGAVSAPALMVTVQGSAVAHLVDNSFARNVAIGSNASTVELNTGSTFGDPGSPTLVARRNVIQDNVTTGGHQLSVIAWGGSRFEITDSRRRRSWSSPSASSLPPGGATWLRTQLKYLPAGQEEPVLVQLEALLPDPSGAPPQQ